MITMSQGLFFLFPNVNLVKFKILFYLKGREKATKIQMERDFFSFTGICPKCPTTAVGNQVKDGNLELHPGL